MITKEHLQSLVSRGISESVAKACGIESLTEGSIKALLGIERNIGGDGFSIPYIFNNNICIGDDGVEYIRYRIVDSRLDHDKPKDFKQAKYLQRQSAGFMPYVPPIINLKSYLVITEGELKAISASTHDIPTISIPGVHMWYDPKARLEGDKLTSDSKVHPVILDMVKTVETVVVLADSDARTNPQVRQAMNLFCEALRNQSQAAVIYKQVPSMSDEKLGLDDLIALDAQNASRFIARSVKECLELHEILAKDGYVALGYQCTDCVVWSRPRSSVIVISDSKLSSPTTLQAIAGIDWCKTVYGDRTKDGDKLRVDYGSMASNIIDECNKKGFYSQLNARGAGVWEDVDGMPIVNSSTLWRLDGKYVDRVTGSIVYESSFNLGIDKTLEAATKEDGTHLFKTLKSWRWRRQSDAALMLGWIAHGFLCGALEWRTHANLTGGKGTGKSTLLTLIRNLYGEYAVLVDGDSSEAGIRQKVRNASRPIIIDEAEAEGNKIAKTLQMLRSASSGAGVLRGTQDQNGMEYILRACGLVAGIVPPQFNSADSSRFLRMELKEAHKGEELPILIRDSQLARELGQKLWMRVLREYPRFKRSLDILKKAILEKMGSSRASDTLGNVIAASWIVLSDDELTTESAKVYFDKFDLEDAQEQQGEDDSQDCLNHIMSSVVRASGGENTICRMIVSVIKFGRASHEYDYLANYGIKYNGIENNQHTILINTASQYFLKLFIETRWQKGSIKTALLRLPGAYKVSTATRICGIACKPISVPIDIEE